MSALMPVHLLLSRRLNELTARWQRLIALARDPYRPERHYMRGPGPKWRAKYEMAERI